LWMANLASCSVAYHYPHPLYHPLAGWTLRVLRPRRGRQG